MTTSSAWNMIDKVINVDQDPIGNSPQSNPATYTGVFDLIRQLFAQLPESKVRGYQPRRFSFNKPGGRCEACEGNGQKKIEMHFLPDVWVECDVCHGMPLQPRDAGRALQGPVHRRRAGDAASTRPWSCSATSPRSAGSCKRWRTSASITWRWARPPRPCPAARPSASSWPPSWPGPTPARTLYILDEPTTGLHFDDIRKLLDVLNRLVDLGNTVDRGRAQPGRDQDGRLGHRPGPGGRPRRRQHRGPGRPRGHCRPVARQWCLTHGRGPGADPGSGASRGAPALRSLCRRGGARGRHRARGRGQGRRHAVDDQRRAVAHPGPSDHRRQTVPLGRQHPHLVGPACP